MKKLILLIMFTFTLTLQAESLGKGNIYCLGIGKAAKTQDGIKFKAILCRIGSKKIKNVTVYHNSHLILDEYDVSKKLMYASIGSEGIFYSSDTKILNVEILDPISRMPADTGSVFPINDRDMREAWVYDGIVKDDLIEVYGNTLGIPAVSRKEYERNYDYNY